MSTDALTAIADAASQQLTRLTEQLYAGQINLVQWSLGTAGTLKDAHLASAALGAGSDSLSLMQLGRTGGTLADEYKHLFDFARGIASGDVSEAQALARIQQYAKASGQDYWREYAQGLEKQAAWAGLPVLTNSPGDGQTECHGHCNCTLRTDDDGIHWDLNAGENCDGCQALAAGGPYRPR